MTAYEYGQVTTTAGHIFELNVLLNFNVNVILLIIIVDLEVSPWAIMSEIQLLCSDGDICIYFLRINFSKKN